MKKKDVTICLDLGFRIELLSGYQKKKYQFVKSRDDFYFVFMHTSVDSDNSFPSTFYFGIGSLKIKKLLEFLFPNKYINITENNYPTQLRFHQIRLFDEGKYPILEYDIYTEEDAQKMVDEVSDYILNTILPEWEANPTLEYLEKKVNEKLSDVPNFSGLILAKLVGNPDYEKIKQHFLNVSKDWAEWDKADLQKVIDFLDNHTTSELNTIADNE